MKKDEVPQDESRTYGGQKKLLYAVSDDGRYEGVPSSDWEVETFATVAAVEAFDALRDAALFRAWQGLTSPLEYHMYARRMDAATLSQAAGYGVWRVKRHFRPRIFSRLSSSRLQRYCDVLALSLDQLRSLPADTRQPDEDAGA